ncbi:hypothetical protein JOF53_007420 [Crossiella equi]|uniref:PucR C-terminal helix-turn-helix domain-containing protein n=1 Tax=Crossiella equi TaxID=130796 RepID=A0ABS5APR3_9PSEU|nr:helix-turn-helix domain-containing protein [Crossiella equi]MBP2478548.1 hypothetical protein [Crossiella equi]
MTHVDTALSPCAPALASHYLLALVRPPVRLALDRPGTLESGHPLGQLLLVPDEADEGVRVHQELAGALGERGWLALARRPADQLTDGVREAAEVLRLVAAGQRPHGVYRVADVLVEYAAVRDQQVAACLAAVVQPLRAHEVLWETLLGLVRADYNRNRLARLLYIHRSTLDYRLRRIAEITGCDPTTGRGAQVLTAAVVVTTLQR